MAQFSNQRKIDTQPKVLNIEFEGVLQTTVQAKLVAELVKYLLYQRQQIPMPIDQLKLHVERIQKTLPPTVTAHQQAVQRRQLSQEKRKCLQLMEAYDKLCDTLNQAFALCISIKSVIILLGPTFVSPKETYVLSFPTNLYEGRILPVKSCVSNVFQKVIGSDFPGEGNQQSCTKVFLLIQAPRKIHPSLELIPKEQFKICKRGKHFEVNFTCSGPVGSADLSCLEDLTFNMSGIEAFSQSFLESDGSGPSSGERRRTRSPARSQRLHHPSSDQSRDHFLNEGTQKVTENSHTEVEVHIDSSALIEQDKTSEAYGCHEDLIWFQIPVVLEGYKIKGSSA